MGILGRVEVKLRLPGDEKEGRLRPASVSSTGGSYGRDGREAGVESQLRHGAAFCRRLAVGTLLVGFASSIAIGFAFERGSGDGLSPQALLALMLVSIVMVLLFVCLFLMGARAMEGLAELLGRTGGLADSIAALEAAQWEAALARAEVERREGPAGTGEQERGVSTGAASTTPGPAGEGEPSPKPASGRPASLAGAVESIRMGRFVKVTTPGGWAGWVQESDLPPTLSRLPVTAAGVPYRPPLPSLSPGRAARKATDGKQPG